MRKRRIGYVGALGLALAVAIPSTAMATGTQNVEAGFSPTNTIAVPPPASVEVGSKDSKTGTLYTRLFLSNIPAGTQPSSAGVFDIHVSDDLTFNTAGLAQCDPTAIEGQNADAAKQICADSLIGAGNAAAALGASGQTVTGPVALFNGTEQAGSPTVLFHSTAGGLPITLIAEMQDSTVFPGGTLFHTLVAVSAGGKVPDGTPIVDTDFTINKDYKDAKLVKKAKKLKKKAKKASGSKAKKLNKKAKKAKKKSKKSWVVGRCIDGTIDTQVNVTYTDGTSQTANDSQTCT
jgi:hypothetical protein